MTRQSPATRSQSPCPTDHLEECLHRHTGISDPGFPISSRVPIPLAEPSATRSATSPARLRGPAPSPPTRSAPDRYRRACWGPTIASEPPSGVYSCRGCGRALWGASRLPVRRQGACPPEWHLAAAERHRCRGRARSPLPPSAAGAYLPSLTTVSEQGGSSSATVSPMVTSASVGCTGKAAALSLVTS